MSLSKRLRHHSQYVQGDVARLLGRLPLGVQTRLGALLRNPHRALDPHLQLLVAAQRHPTPVVQVRSLTVSGHEGQPLEARLYRPSQAGRVPLVLFYHGGGFVVGDLDTHDEACRLLCQSSECAVLSVAYRLAPEAPAPMAALDALAALQWAHAHAAELQADPSQLVVAGDSAGGNLAAVVAQLARDLPCRPQVQLLWYPVVDVGESYPSHQTYSEGLFLSQADMDHATRHYVGQNDPHDPRISPLRGDLRNLPPALVYSCELDVLRDEGELYARHLREAGNQVELHRVGGMPHGFINITPISRTAHDATVRSGRRLKQRLMELREQPAA